MAWEEDYGIRIGAAVHVTRAGAEKPGQWGHISPAIILLPKEEWARK